MGFPIRVDEEDEADHERHQHPEQTWQQDVNRRSMPAAALEQTGSILDVEARSHLLADRRPEAAGDKQGQAERREDDAEEPAYRGNQPNRTHDKPEHELERDEQEEQLEAREQVPMELQPVRKHLVDTEHDVARLGVAEAPDHHGTEEGDERDKTEQKNTSHPMHPRSQGVPCTLEGDLLLERTSRGPCLGGKVPAGGTWRFR